VINPPASSSVSQHFGLTSGSGPFAVMYLFPLPPLGTSGWKFSTRYAFIAVALDKGMLGGSLNCPVINMYGLSSHCISWHEREGVLMFDLVSPYLNMRFVRKGGGQVSTLRICFVFWRGYPVVFV